MSENKIQTTELDKIQTKATYDDSFKLKAGIFLSAVTGISALIGFGTTVMAVKKQDPKYFSKGITGSIEMTETGAGLALRALGWGSLYAITGCSILFYTIWKISGAKDIEEFKYKMGSILPRLPKNNPQHGRTEFSGLNDLLAYLSEEKGKNDP